MVIINQKIGDFNDKNVSEWIVNYIASYKKPRRYLVVNDLPRNAMGKVVKNDIKKMFVQKTIINYEKFYQAILFHFIYNSAFPIVCTKAKWGWRQLN